MGCKNDRTVRKCGSDSFRSRSVTEWFYAHSCHRAAVEPHLEGHGGILTTAAAAVVRCWCIGRHPTPPAVSHHRYWYRSRPQHQRLAEEVDGEVSVFAQARRREQRRTCIYVCIHACMDVCTYGARHREQSMEQRRTGGVRDGVHHPYTVHPCIHPYTQAHKHTCMHAYMHGYMRLDMQVHLRRGRWSATSGRRVCPQEYRACRPPPTCHRGPSCGPPTAVCRQRARTGAPSADMPWTTAPDLQTRALLAEAHAPPPLTKGCAASRGYLARSTPWRPSRSKGVKTCGEAARTMYPQPSAPAY